MPVHLYGQPADLDGIGRVAARHGLLVVEDCCQAHLATHGGVPVGTTTAGGAFSFYPTKNLGALGDGGAVITNDAALAARVRRLRNGGQAAHYVHVERGVNSRLDELQAAILRSRLPRLADWTLRRRALAAQYRRLLPATAAPVRERDAGHVYHLFPIRSSSRDPLRAHLFEAGVETLIHYPVPLHEQPVLVEYGARECPVAARVTRELLSLPLRPQLTDAAISRVADAVAAFERTLPA